MKNTPDFFHGLFAGVSLLSGLFLTGCASPGPEAVVEFQNVGINGKPAHLLLDTGSAATLLTGSGADRLGVKVTPPSAAAEARAVNGRVALGVSEPAQVTMGGQTFTVPLPVLDLPWYVYQASETDGLVSWAEVRNNILVFDGDKRTIGAVANLPAETAGWLKLKIRPNAHLLLELPVADGTTGVLLVDTGDPSGVSLPPAEWKAWRAAHPQALTASSTYYTPGSGVVKGELAWADEIKLGSLTVTDVAVRLADASESGIIRNFAGTLGLYALTRLDLVVDGISGYAYLKSKPGPGPYFPSINRPGVTEDSAKTAAGTDNWKVTDTVQVQFSNLLERAAAQNYAANDYASALANLNHILELNPEDTAAYSNRATVKMNLGDSSGAIADYSHIIDQDPKNFLVIRDRGIARDVAGDLAGALADFDQAVELRPNGSINPQPHLYRLLLQRQLGRPVDDISAAVAGWRQGWPKTNGQFLTGSLTEADYLAAAGKGEAAPVRRQQREAYYFIGMMRLIKGDQAGAKDFFQKCVAMGRGVNANDYLLSQGELARMK